MNELMKVLLNQEEELQFTSFTNADALKLGLIMIDFAKENFPKGIAVYIEKDKVPLFTHYMEGTTLDNVYWVNVKKNVVNYFGHSSLYVGEMYKDMGTAFNESTQLSPDEYRAEGGSFPLIVKGSGVVGSITVSGLKGEEDHSVAVEGIKKFLSK